MLLGSLILSGVAAPVWAATYSQDFGPSVGGGYGHYDGNLNFTGAKTFNYAANVRDVCPSDGYGVSLVFLTRFSTGVIDVGPAKVWDTNGCGNGIEYGTGSVSFGTNITWVKSTGFWTNDGDLKWSQAANSTSNEKDNPYT